MRLVVVCARIEERDAVLRGLGAAQLARLPAYPHTRVAHPGVGTVVVMSAGAGPATAVAAGVAGDRLRPDAILSMGLARGLGAGAPAGTIVLADRIIGADLGSSTGSTAPGTDADLDPGFRSLERLGLGPTAYDVPSALLDTVTGRVETTGEPVRVGPVLSVGAVPATVAAGTELKRRHPGALAVAREGYGVAVAAASSRVPALEVRVLSDVAGTAREAGIDPAALDVLAAASSALFAREWDASAPAATG